MSATTVGWPKSPKAQMARSYALVNGSRIDILDQVAVRHDGDVFTDGNIYSTNQDIERWITALVGGKVLSRDSFEVMMTPYLGEYGYGWSIYEDSENRRVFSHSGSWLGYKSWIKRFRDDDVTIVFYSNQTISRALRREFLEKIEDAILD